MKRLILFFFSQLILLPIDLTKITSLSPEQSLQGKVTGVQVTRTSGAPGALPELRVRGVGTFNNSSPIFVVDGVIVDPFE